MIKTAVVLFLIAIVLMASAIQTYSVAEAKFSEATGTRTLAYAEGEILMQRGNIYFGAGAVAAVLGLILGLVGARKLW